MNKVYLLITAILVVVSGCGSQVMDKNMIFEAIELGDIVRVQQYLTSGSDINVRKDYYGDGIPPLELKATTPLHLAAIMDNKEIVDLLLANGADVNAKAEGDVTPLLIAISKKDKRMVELLLANGANVNTIIDGGATPLHFAYLGGNKEIIDLLIANGADVTAKDDNGLTPAEADINEAIDEAREMLKKVWKELK